MLAYKRSQHLAKLTRGIGNYSLLRLSSMSSLETLLKDLILILVSEEAQCQKHPGTLVFMLTGYSDPKVFDLFQS